ncbi:longitudinals lacking protein-like [Drosophila obscura]|uniref:longitudinals lacking protein-like n=1 Tax=Drosophila obscura TaxID=7282 RepID=UPI001BB1C451|nr:longitudinals lacking protein-like [Drosophila obscura]
MDNYKVLSLHWDYHQRTLISAFATLRETETLVDCTLCAEGKFLKFPQDGSVRLQSLLCRLIQSALRQEYDHPTEGCHVPGTPRPDGEHVPRRDQHLAGPAGGASQGGRIAEIKGLCAVAENEAHESANSSVLQAAASKRKSAGLAAAKRKSAVLAAAAVISKKLSGGGSKLPTQQQPWIIWRINKITNKPQLQTSDANNTENVLPQGQGAAFGGVTLATLGAGACAGAVRTMVVGKQLTADVGKSSSNRKQKDKNNDRQTNAHRGSTNSTLRVQASSSSGNRTFKRRNEIGMKGKPVYECQQCGRQYTWKECLRRHDKFECGDKEPRHLCPYCPYKSKQSGNLGTHMRRIHADRPAIIKKRGRVPLHQLNLPFNL